MVTPPEHLLATYIDQYHGYGSYHGHRCRMASARSQAGGTCRPGNATLIRGSSPPQVIYKLMRI